MRIFRSLAIAGLAVSVALSPGRPAVAQSKFAQPALAQGTPSGGSQLSVPPAETLVLLIRLSLLTLNDAILTGNYSVLRDRGGPAFRQANSASGLARVFTTLEAQRPDLAAVATMVPQLSEAQIAGPSQHLVVKGHFPMRPLQINFELVYEPADGQWQLFGLSVGAVPAQSPPAPAQAPAKPEKPVAKAPSKPAEGKAAPPAKK